jgi:glycosyltransferase involved in cell wall biosynthesis
MPKVSIITVTFNCRDLLIQTIENVFSQSFNDFEYIVIDGKSSDGTVDIINDNLDKISFWISEPDKGIYDAMNKGLNAATGEYVIFLNAGDTFYEPNTLNKIPFQKFPKADIFYGETMILDKERNPLGLRRKKLPHNLTWKHFRNGMVVCHQSILVKQGIAPEYDHSYKYAADIDWVLKVLKLSNETIFTETIISNFIEGGFSSQKQKESWAERFKIMRNNFGLTTTLLKHIQFLGSNLFMFVGLIPKYRKLKSFFPGQE